MSRSRPETPDSPSSLRKATATIDDLTAALSNFNRVPSPDPPDLTVCCCGREDCDSSKAWAALKSKLENRLILTAEVGQALLERHEAYVRRHESGHSADTSFSSSLNDYAEEALTNKRTHEEVDARVAELVRENAVLEKRLSEALVNNEIVDLTHHSTLEELTQAKEKIAHLSAQNARYIGLDSRLAAALQERDDMHQERNSALQTAKMAEARIASLKEKCAKLQAQVGRLREDLEAQRAQRREMSEEVLSDARERIRQLQQLHMGHTSVEDSEVGQVLESLVADNEAYKHDNAELQNLLAETREDLRTLQEELDEHRARHASMSRHRPHDSIGSSLFDDATTLASPFHVGTAPVTSTLHSMFASQRAGPSTERRAASSERFLKRGFEPLTPETTRRPLSPIESHLSASRPNAFGRRYASSRRSYETDDQEPESPIKPTAHKSLLVLTKSKAVQTELVGTPGSPFVPSPLPRLLGDQISSHDGQSDSSTLADSNPSVVGVLIERVSALLNRLTQADALTLTTRLKRQHLHGADVSHLSRTTVNSILNESNALRSQFRAWLEDDKITTTCTRRDLRALFKLFKELFTELGQLRVTLNDVILDPTVAGKVSEMALNPSKAAPPAAAEGSSAASSSTPGWIAPLSKFLGLPSGSGQDDAAARALSPPVRPSSRGAPRPPPRLVPKREPALSASAMTVNVEFSSTVAGRAVTTTSSANNDGTGRSGDLSMLTASASTSSISPAAGEGSRSVMDIFAGAPRASNPPDSWVVIPKPSRSTSLNTRRYDLAGGATIGRSALRNAANANSTKLSRVVDAVIDDPQPDAEERDAVPDTLLQRTLRPRGLSDSSIRTTFLNQGDDGDGDVPQDAQPERPDRQSVLQALSRKMQSFRQASSSFVGPSRSAITSAEPAAVSTPSRPDAAAPILSSTAVGATSNMTIRRASQSTSPHVGSLFPTLNLATWAAALDPGEGLQDDAEPRPPVGMYVPAPREAREELNRAWSKGL